MQTVSNPASNGNPTSENTHEQLLSLLGELTNKLDPAPAPKPEPVKLGQLYLAPCQELRESMTRHMEAAEKDAKQMMREIKKFIRTCPPAESENAWDEVFKHSMIEMDMMLLTLGYHTSAIDRHAWHIAHIAVMANGGDMGRLQKEWNRTIQEENNAGE